MKHRLIGKCKNGILSGLLGHEQSQRVYHIFDMQKEFVVHPIINFPLTNLPPPPHIVGISCPFPGGGGRRREFPKF